MLIVESSGRCKDRFKKLLRPCSLPWKLHPVFVPGSVVVQWFHAKLPSGLEYIYIDRRQRKEAEATS